MATEAQAGVLAIPGRRIDFGLGRLRRFARRQPLGTVSAFVIAGLVLMAVFADAPFMRTSDPKEFGSDILVGPSADHWFGTNRNGQDLYSRVVYGARPSLMVGIATVLISVVGGTVLGLLAGYLGRFVDTLISRLSEVLLSFPAILFGLVVATWLGPGLRSVIIAVVAKCRASPKSTPSHPKPPSAPSPSTRPCAANAPSTRSQAPASSSSPASKTSSTSSATPKSSPPGPAPASGRFPMRRSWPSCARAGCP